MLALICVVLVLLSGVHCNIIAPTILFTYQSQGIQYTAWFSLFTLCLAPLVAHVIGGVSAITIIGDDSKAPNWLALLPHYNPISIVWRYSVIADRRLRARNWDKLDMAACNAVFWDADRGRWDGSENIMIRSRDWITKLPEKSHVSIVSASMFTTIVLSFQGGQAIFIIFARLLALTDKAAAKYNFTQGVPVVFVPLGVLALMRLPAALWLSNDHGYLNTAAKASNCALLETKEEGKEVSMSRIFETRLGEKPLDPTTDTRLHTSHGLKGFAYRVFWTLSVIAILGGSFAACTRIWWGYASTLPYDSSSRLSFQVMYLCTTGGGMLITLTYIFLGSTHTTIIPCIHAAWYKIYTSILMIMAVIAVLLAALETRQLQNGIITTLPEFYCPGSTVVCVPVPKGQGNSNI